MNSENWELELYDFLVKSFFSAFSGKKEKCEFKLNNRKIEIESYFSNKSHPINIPSKLLKNLGFLDKATLIFTLKINNKEFILIKKEIDEIEGLERVSEKDYEIIKYLYKNISSTIRKESNPNNTNEDNSQSKKDNKIIYLLCSLDNGHYSSIEKSLREKKLSNFDKDEINALAYSIFAYWEGEQGNEPESIKEIINIENLDVSDSKEGYFLIYFEKNDLARKTEVEKLYEPSVYQREDALNYMKEYLRDKYKISKIFSKLPDGCKII